VIPLYKLEKLPRTQKLRKIAKIFTMAENRLLSANEKKADKIFTASEIAFFADASKLLMNDPMFSIEAQKAFNGSFLIFQETSQQQGDDIHFRRALNNVKHLLLTATGKDQSDWDFTESNGRLDSVKRQIFEGMLVYFEDIRSPFNVGAMFRTAESFGVEKIILSPYCADPNHRRAQRTAMGCIDISPWERQDIFGSQEIPELPYPVFALETGGTPINQFLFPRRGLLIAGSEELGVSPRALAAADASLGRISIPCYGAKASLNVSVAFGIAVQQWAQANINKKE
jgi:TrmH family RNA methyltransferase